MSAWDITHDRSAYKLQKLGFAAYDEVYQRLTMDAGVSCETLPLAKDLPSIDDG